MRKLPRYHHCFACGRSNQAGLDMTWIQHDDNVRGLYTGQEKHNSYEGIIHGGIISTLLDECIGWAISLKEKAMFVTGSLNLVFKEPILVGQTITTIGYWSENQPVEKKYRLGHGSIVDDAGKVYATAEGMFFPLPSNYQDGIIKLLEMPDKPGKEVTFEDIWG